MALSCLLYKDKYFHDHIRQGVPKTVLSSEGIIKLESTLTKIEYSAGVTKRRIKPKNQVKCLDLTLANICDTPYLYAIGGKTDLDKSKYTALCLLDEYYDYIQKYNMDITELTDRLKEPYWFNLSKNYDNRLKEIQLGNIDKPGFIVIDALYENSTSFKIEKARDLIEYFNDVPKVILICGMNPIEYCRNTLYEMPNKVLYFEDSFDLETVEI